MKDIACSVIRPVTVLDASIPLSKLISMGVEAVNAFTVALSQKVLDVLTARIRITRPK